MVSTTRALRKLRRAIDDSHDRLVLVRIPGTKSAPPTLHLGQIHPSDQQPQLTTRFGVYRVRWWRQHLCDAKERSLVDSRFWPDTWTLSTDGSLGHPQAIRPSKVAQTLESDATIQWRSGDISLAEDLLVGPFNFTQIRLAMQGPKRRAISEQNRIDRTYWSILMSRAPSFQVDVTNIHTTPT